MDNQENAIASKSAIKAQDEKKQLKINHENEWQMNALK